MGRMTMWPFSRKKPKYQPPARSYAVDMDQDSIPLEGDDPTSVFMQLAMKGESAMMSWNDDIGVWQLHVGDHPVIETATQAEALSEAKRLYL